MVTDNTPATVPTANIAPPLPAVVEFSKKTDPEIVRFTPVKFMAPPLPGALLLENLQLVMVRLPKVTFNAPPAALAVLFENIQLVNDKSEATF